MEKRITISGIILLSKSAYSTDVKVRLGKGEHCLTDIIMDALGEEISDGYDQRYTGAVNVEIKLEKNKVQVSNGDIWSHKLVMTDLYEKGEKNDLSQLRESAEC